MAAGWQRHRGDIRTALAVLLATLALAPALPASQPAAQPKKALTDKELRDLEAAHQAQLAEEEFARYAGFTVLWTAARGLPQVHAVFPHPAVPSRVILATSSGLLLSDDAGRMWQGPPNAEHRVWGPQPLPAAAADKIGVVRDVAFKPDSPDVFWLATAGRGLWATEDGGKTVRQVAAKATGLAADEIVSIHVCPGDPRFRTLYACHGRRAAGLSRSHDGGKTWGIIARDYHVQRIFRATISWGGSTFTRTIVIASRTDSPDLMGAHACTTLDDLWSEVLRDVVYVDGAPALSGREAYLATADKGLIRLRDSGGIGVGPPDVTAYASVGVTWGPRADKEMVYAYEPSRLGLIVSLDGMKTCTAHSRGLYVGPFVKQGAHVRANANGRVFYAAVNGGLYVGRVRSRGLTVAEAALGPPVFAYERTAYDSALAELHEEILRLPRVISAAAAAQALLQRAQDVRRALSAAELAVTARIIPPGQRPRSVTADLTDLGGPSAAAMCDDGRHGDGDANDGLYGATFPIDPRLLHRRDRPPEAAGDPGLRPVSIKAAAADGTIAGAVVALSVYGRPESFVMWDDGRGNPLAVEDGNAAIDDKPRPSEAYSGENCLKLQTGQGPWRASFGRRRGLDNPWNITGYWALSFWMRREGPGDQDVAIQLRDVPEFDDPVTTPPVHVVRDKLVEGGKLDDRYRRVVIPLDRILARSPAFRTERFGLVVLSGDGKSPATFWIDKVCVHVNPEGLANEESLSTGPRKPRPRRERRTDD